MDTNKIIQIAEDLGFADLSKDLMILSQKGNSANCPLVLPLVGEFSAGKTTLINALTDSKKLETATKPTTATIYEIHFGCDVSHAKVMNGDGTITEVSDIAELKNEILADATVVEVYDTSSKVPSSTILVDTPGLSSPDPRHKQTLVDFLPLADAILLVSDINQQITRSTTDFIKTISLSKRPIYIVLTKSDTKAESEIVAAKEYISNNTQLPVEHIVCVSAAKGYLDELYSLFEDIQKSKNEILVKVNNQRLKNIADEILKRINDLLAASASDKDADEAIRSQQYELKKLNRNIDSLIESIQSDIAEIERNTIRSFEDKIFDRLDNLVAGKSTNFDTEAVAAINTTSSLLTNEFKTAVKECISKKATKLRESDGAIDLRSIVEMDLSAYSVNGLSYNLNLNQVGHEYDGWIANGVKVVAVAAAACAGGAVAGGSALFDAADTASDVLFDGDKAISTVNNSVTSQNPNGGKGIVESVVGFFTEQYAGKPQRRRAIHNYMDGTLVPEFKTSVNNMSVSLMQTIREDLRREASSTVEEMTNILESMKKERSDKVQEFNQRMEKLQVYKNELLTI